MCYLELEDENCGKKDIFEEIEFFYQSTFCWCLITNIVVINNCQIGRRNVHWYTGFHRFCPQLIIDYLVVDDWNSHNNILQNCYLSNQMNAVPTGWRSLYFHDTKGEIHRRFPRLSYIFDTSTLPSDTALSTA